MGKYDDISAERLRTDLVRFAELLLRLDKEDGLLTSPADIQRILGELRQKLFAWEVRRSRSLGAGAPQAGTDAPVSAEDPTVSESLRIVKEALRREGELLRAWEAGESPDVEEDDEGA